MLEVRILLKYSSDHTRLPLEYSTVFDCDMSNFELPPFHVSSLSSMRFCEPSAAKSSTSAT